jgi:hypothetical protein
MVSKLQYIVKIKFLPYIKSKRNKTIYHYRILSKYIHKSLKHTFYLYYLDKYSDSQIFILEHENKKYYCVYNPYTQSDTYECDSYYEELVTLFNKSDKKTKDFLLYKYITNFVNNLQIYENVNSALFFAKLGH